MKHTKLAAQDRFRAFDRHGDISLIARELGEKLSTNYGPKYFYEFQGIEVRVDDYGRFTTVRYQKDNRVLYSSHVTEKIMLDGNWIDALLECTDDALRAKADREAGIAIEKQQSASKRYAPLDLC